MELTRDAVEFRAVSAPTTAAGPAPATTPGAAQ